MRLQKLLNFFIAAIILCCVHGTCGYNLTVLTKNGYVEGYKQPSSLYPDDYYFAFKGIPYAEPPVGALRFKDPQPVSSWEGVKETKTYAEVCAATESECPGSQVVGAEDCLYVNIFVPNTDKSNSDLSLPVMVWIHGGAFVVGNSQLDPSYLLEKPVIVASLAYRLGVLGFLSTQDENAWGNAGLKDQTLALKWIKENIEFFGGNPNNITIFGLSAGGASIEYQLITPTSAGLFSQAISQSGSTLNEWGFQKNPLDVTMLFSKIFKINSNDTKEIVQELQKVDVRALAALSQKVDGFKPSVEVDHEGAFVNDSSYNIWSSGKFNKVPVMIGHTTEDGSYGSDKYWQCVRDHKTVIPAGLNVDKYSPEADEVVAKIADHFFPNNSFENFTKYMEFNTQHYFVRGIRKTVGDLVKASIPVYYYEFSYVSTQGYTNGVNGGAGHGEDLLYLFFYRNLTSDDKIMKDRMVTMYTNFVIHGNPTPDLDPLLGMIWPQAGEKLDNEDDVRYLNMGKELVPGISPHQSDFLFWRDLFKNYSRSTVFTY